MEVTHGISMVNSYGQKPMENSWIIPHDFSMGHFCKGGGDPIREILGPTDLVGAKSPIFGLFSLVAPQP